MGKADAQATFAINLEDGTSKTAESAAGALKKLQASIQADNAALRAMSAAMKNLKGATTVNIEQVKALKQQIDAKKQSIASAQSSYISLGGSLNGVKGKSQAAKDAFAELQKNAQALPGPVGSIASQFGALKGMLAGGAIALGVAAIALAVVALTAATVAAVASLFKYGLAQGNAARAELLRLEGLTKMRNWYGIAAGSATEMQGAIDRVSASSALGRDKVGQYSEQLYKAGLRGENLAVALEAASIKASVQGDAAASAFVGWAAGANLAGRSVKALADDVKARLGGIAARQMLDLDVQSQKLHESYAALFTGIDFEPVLAALKGITDLFSQSTYSGKALKTIVTVMFKPMIATVEFLGPLVKRFFQGIIIGALLVGIGLLKLRSWFRKTFGDPEVTKGIDPTFAALKLGVFVVTVITAAFAGLLAIVTLILMPFITLAGGIYGVYTAGKKLVTAFLGLPWKKMGTAIVDGIVNGVKGGAKWVIDAVTRLGTSAMKALKDTLGISSPSKVFAKLGLSLPQGVTAGVEAGTPGARRAVANIVDAPSIPAVPSSPAGAPAPTGAQKFVTINVGDVNVTAQDGQQAASIAADIKRELMRVLEGVAIEIWSVASMTWNPIDEPCDYIRLSDVKSPGLADVSGASSVRRWDEREGFGISGAFSVFKGRGLAHFSVKLRLYSVEDWDGWHAFKPFVDKLPTRRGGTGKDSGVLDIWHPLLEGLDIKAVAAAEVMQPEQTDSGEWTIEIKFLEFRYPKIALAKPDAAAATPVDPVEEKIIKPLLKQMQSLSDEQ